MIKTLSFSVTGQRIEIVEPAMLVSGTVNIYNASFSFDADWDGFQRTAVFSVDGVSREQLLTDDACTLPWEVLTAGKYLRVGVYGTKGEKRLPTIWTEHALYISSGAGPTEEAAEPSPTLVEQLLTKVGNLDTLKTEDKSSLVAAINEVWASGGGGGGASVTDAAINEDGNLIITLSTGKQIDAGYAVGPAGAGGKSAYQYAKDGGYTGTEAEFAAKMAAEIPAVDTTLTESGKAADAAAVGARLSSLSEEIANISSGGSGGNGADYSFLTGLKYYACGDSIVDIQGTLTAPETFGDSGYSTDLQGRSIGEVTAEGYVTEIERRYGLVATNCGNSGHTLVQDYASLAAKDYSDVALVTIAYGCNDARTNVPLGTVNSTDVTTFAGALNQLLRKIYTDNPECRVIVLTPIQRLYVSDFGIGTANANGNYLVDFVDMSKKVAAKRSTKCIDMYRDCGINQTNLYYYTVEGVHPVNQGFARMKGAIIPVLDDMFALEYEPFGTMTNTGGTEPDEPDTGGDSGGDTPPEEEPGPNVVDLSGLFVLTGFYWDPWGAFKSDANVAGNDHPGVALEGGHTYTLTTYLPCSADATWGYGGAIADNPSMNPAGGTTLSFGKKVGTFEVVTINGSYYGKCSYTFTIDAGKTNYLYTARAANLDDSYVSLTYI